MKKICLYILASFFIVTPVLAGHDATAAMETTTEADATVEEDGPVAEAEKEYKMRVDGMACPYCAYGIEKKFKKIDGVKTIDVDLNEGIVSVCTSDQIDFSDDQLTQLFKDAGFTYRSTETEEQCETL